jgi:hypothetical protein
MRTALMILLGIAGVLLLPEFTWSGIGLLMLAYFVGSRARVGDGEQFIGVLMLGGAVGAAALFVSFAIDWIRTRL